MLFLGVCFFLVLQLTDSILCFIEPALDVEREFDKVQNPFMIKTLSKVRIEGALFNIIKAIYERPTDALSHLSYPT